MESIQQGTWVHEALLRTTKTSPHQLQFEAKLRTADGMEMWAGQTREMREYEGAFPVCDRAHGNAVVCAAEMVRVLCGIQRV